LAASSTLQSAFECRDSLTDSRSFYGHKLRSQVDATTLTLKNGQKQFVQSIKAEMNYFDRVSRINRELENP